MSKVLIIAEAGVNHNGSIEMAKQLVDAAADAGVDYVKFQTFKAEKLVSKAAKKAEYQTNNIGDGDDSQYNMLKKLELSDEMHLELIEYCKIKGITFFSTGFDLESVDYINPFISLHKIPSGEITNKPYLEHVAKKGKPIILSTGMSTLDEVRDAVNVLTKSGVSKSNLWVLHCNSEYPTPMEDVNLLAMIDIKSSLNVKVGYSDHTLGIEVPIAAVALGAEVIEKHFTLDRNLPGPDHAASLEPAELKAMVSAIRNIEKAIGGSGKKEISASESKNRSIGRKSLHFAKDLNSGHVLTLEDFEILRPGNGLSPMIIEQLLGKRLLEDVKEKSIVSLNQIA